MNTTPDPQAEQRYRESIRTAHEKWCTDVEAIDGQFALPLARATSTGTAGDLYTEYIGQRQGTRKVLDEMIAQAAQRFMAETGLAWTPKLEPTLPVPPAPIPAPTFESPTAIPLAHPLPARLTSKQPSPKGKRALLLIGLALVVVVVIGIWSSLNKSSASNSSVSSSSGSTYKTTVEVLYEVEGTATGTDITLESGTGTMQLTGKAVPLANKTTGKRGLTATMSRGAFAYISAQNTGKSGTITCKITVDGVLISTNTSSGSYAIASCKGKAG